MLFRDGKHEAFEFFNRIIIDLFAHHAAEIKFLYDFGKFGFCGGNDRFGQIVANAENFFLRDVIGKSADRRSEQKLDLVA
jgi:hypothetical protein